MRADNSGDTDAQAGRGIDIRADHLMVSGSDISASAGGQGRSGDITVAAKQMQIVNATLTSNSDGAGRLALQGGDITIRGSTLLAHNTGARNAQPDRGIAIRAENLTVTDYSRVRANPTSSGQGGNFTVSVEGELQVLNGTGIGASVGDLVAGIQYGAAGNAGRVTVTAHTLKVDGGNARGAGINSLVIQPSTGNAGKVEVDVAGGIDILNGGFITADTHGVGDAAKVSVKVGKLLSLTQGGSLSSTSFGTGNAGGVTVNAGQLLIEGTLGPAFTGISTGAIEILSGQGGDITVTVQGEMEMKGGGQINATTSGAKNAGKVTVTADDLAILNGSVISASTVGLGRAGDIQVTANNLTVDGETMAFAGIGSETGLITIPNEKTGYAGNIMVVVANEFWLDTSTNNLTVHGQIPVNGVAFASIANLAGLGVIPDEQTGDAGNIRIDATGRVALLRGGEINSTTSASGKAGNVWVNAQQLVIDRQDAMTVNPQTGEQVPALPGIITAAVKPYSGQGGDITVQVEEEVDLMGGRIASDTFGSEKGGTILLDAREVSLSQGGGISTSTAGPGNAGSIVIDAANSVTLDGVADDLEWVGLRGEPIKGQISGIYLNTHGSGNGGNLSLTTNRLTLSDGGVISAVANDGATKNTPETQAGNIDIETRTVTISGGGLIATTTSGAGQAGSVIVNAVESLDIRGQFDRTRHASVTNPRESEYSGILSNASRILNPEAIDLGPGGSVTLTTPVLSLRDGGEISVSTEGAQKAGDVVVRANTLSLNDASITSEAKAGSGGNAGTVDVFVNEQATLINGGIISTSTAGRGDAGGVAVTADSLDIDGAHSAISSQVNPGATGHAGNVKVAVAVGLAVANGGAISSSTASASTDPAGVPPHGQIEVTARQLALTGGGQITASTSGPDDAGTVRVKTHELTLDGQNQPVPTAITSEALAHSTGQAGTVTVDVTGGKASLSHGGLISSSTQGQGNAGRVTVDADTLTIDGPGSAIASRAQPGAGGHAGDVAVNVSDDLSLRRQGAISSATASTRPAAASPSGQVGVTAGRIALASGGQITASSAGPDDAGHLSVATLELTVDGNRTGITSEAQAGASGRAGNVSVDVRDDLVTNSGALTARAKGRANGTVTGEATGQASLSHGGLISSSNQGSGDAGQVVFRGNRLSLDQAHITTQARQGRGGAILIDSRGPLSLLDSSITTSVQDQGDAGSITIHADSVQMRRSSFATEAVNGDGGAIALHGGRTIHLEDSEITTSVTGRTNGNGGDIALTGDFLFMDTGFIQANTAAPQAHGGNIDIDVRALIPSGGTLQVGGDQPLQPQRGRFGYNVIQAAAPDGVSGAIGIGAPQLDLSGAISTLASQPVDLSPLTRDYCNLSQGSSLSRLGQGALPPKAGAESLVIP